ncbi:TOBE domain-containing protein [Siccirubricoccus deserti]
MRNRVTGRCTAVEFFGAVRRHVLELADGSLLKYDQFGALAPRFVTGQVVDLGWRAEDAVLHAP